MNYKKILVLVFVLCTSIFFKGFNPIVFAQSTGFDYQIDILGGSVVEQGTTLPLTFYNQLLSGTPGLDDLDQLQFTDEGSGHSLPDGGIDYNCPESPNQIAFNNVACVGTYPNYGVYGFSSSTGEGFSTTAAPAWINLVISPTATLGTHTILVTGTSSAEGVVKTATLTIDVLSAGQLALTQNSMLPTEPIPQVAKWQSDMTTWGNHWCPYLNPQYFNGYIDESIMFYDGIRAYYQMADYTHDSSWNNCASSVATHYNGFLSAGNPQGYRVFTKGLLLDSQRTANASSTAGVSQLATAASKYYGLPLHMTDPSNIRESSYALEAMLDGQTLNGTSYPLLQQSETALLGQLDQIFIQKHFTFYQPFMVGLAMEALIQYNEKYPDPRVPYIIKQSLDALWNTAWRPDLHGFYYRCYSTNLPGLPAGLPAGNKGCFSPDVAGPGTADANAWPWTPSDTFDYNDVEPDLNNLISPAFAWMYLQTGDNTYRERGDSLFADGVAYNNFLQFAGKGFSQEYRWTFDFLNWRNQANSQGENSVVDTQPPTVSIALPYSGSTITSTISLVADASDNVHVTAVQFRLNGTTNIGPAVTAVPFEQLNVPTYLFPNGSGTITAIAYDAAGNSTESAPITVNFNSPSNTAIAACPSNNIPTGSFQSCYYNYTGTNIWDDVYGGNDAANPPPVPNLGNLIATTNESTINWQSTPSVSGLNNSSFSVVWQGKENFNTGATTFTATTDSLSGMRVYIDGQMMYNGWSPVCVGLQTCPAPTAVNFTVNFVTSGTHLIRVESWHDYGSYTAELSWNNSVSSAPPDTTPPVDITPPIFSSVTSSSLTTSGAVVTWTTDENSDSQVQYGLTTAYGQSTSLDTVLRNKHSVVISGLLPNTTYHYIVKSTDGFNNTATSSDQTFVTSVAVTAPGGGGGSSGPTVSTPITPIIPIIPPVMPVSTTTVPSSPTFITVPTVHSGTGYIATLQSFLNKNVPNTNIVADGIFGHLTIAAIKTFQALHGLTPDGIMGAQTRAVMNGLAGK